MEAKAYMNDQYTNLFSQYKSCNLAKPVLFSLLIFSLLIINSAYSKTLYQYKDNNGNLVITDKKPNNERYSERNIQTLSTSKAINISQWSKTPTINLPKPKRKKPKTTESTSLSKRCSKSLEQIAKLKKQLKQRIEASKFDKAKERLSELRWFRRQKC